MKQEKLINGWGQFPKMQATVLNPETKLDLINDLKKGPLIGRGSGLSYGDSALARTVLETKNFKQTNFENTSGLLTCDASVKLIDILQLVIPQGWFLPVTPGTGLITAGGAIASDVHGKNHFNSGTFSQNLISLDLLLGNGEIVTASRTENPELFYATCGGMGLTGIILSCKIKLKAISSSNIEQTVIRMNNLKELLEAFVHHSHHDYSVAWIDGLATRKDLGRSILYLGNHAKDNQLAFESLSHLSVPHAVPSGLLNSYTLKAYNFLYPLRTALSSSKQSVSYNQYFYPLDRIRNWNRLYGDRGFIQYQFVIPEASALNGIQEVLNEIHLSGQTPYLAVLKRFGEKNDNLLSFPIKGYSLALDFKVNPEIIKLIARLDLTILDYGGRIYLAKDALLSEHSFKSSYKKWEEFEKIRHQYHAIGKFSSNQSKRLGLA